MICPKCGADTKVIETRTAEKNQIRRRRECLECKYRFTTYEITQIVKARYELAEKSYKIG